MLLAGRSAPGWPVIRWCRAGQRARLSSVKEGGGAGPWSRPCGVSEVCPASGAGRGRVQRESRARRGNNTINTRLRASTRRLSGRMCQHSPPPRSPVSEDRCLFQKPRIRPFWAASRRSSKFGKSPGDPWTWRERAGLVRGAAGSGGGRGAWNGLPVPPSKQRPRPRPARRRAPGILTHKAPGPGFRGICLTPPPMF